MGLPDAARARIRRRTSAGSHAGYAKATASPPRDSSSFPHSRHSAASILSELFRRLGDQFPANHVAELGDEYFDEVAQLGVEGVLVSARRRTRRMVHKRVMGPCLCPMRVPLTRQIIVP